jgi:hypothetical protein
MKKYLYSFIVLSLLLAGCKNDFKPRSARDRILIYLIDSVFTEEKGLLSSSEKEFNELHEKLENYLFNEDSTELFINIKEDILPDNLFSGKIKLIKTSIYDLSHRSIPPGGPGYTINFLLIDNHLYKMPGDFNRILRNYKVKITDSNFVQLAKLFIEVNSFHTSKITCYDFGDFYYNRYYGIKRKYNLRFEAVTIDTIRGDTKFERLINYDWFFSEKDNQFYEVTAIPFEEIQNEIGRDRSFSYLMYGNEIFYIFDFLPVYQWSY